jgi:hypothetical protein
VDLRPNVGRPLASCVRRPEHCVSPESGRPTGQRYEDAYECSRPSPGNDALNRRRSAPNLGVNEPELETTAFVPVDPSLHCHGVFGLSAAAAANQSLQAKPRTIGARGQESERKLALCRLRPNGHKFAIANDGWSNRVRAVTVQLTPDPPLSAVAADGLSPARRSRVSFLR